MGSPEKGPRLLENSIGRAAQMMGKDVNHARLCRQDRWEVCKTRRVDPPGDRFFRRRPEWDAGSLAAQIFMATAWLNLLLKHIFLRTHVFFQDLDNLFY